MKTLSSSLFDIQAWTTEAQTVTVPLSDHSPNATTVAPPVQLCSISSIPSSHLFGNDTEVSVGILELNITQFPTFGYFSFEVKDMTSYPRLDSSISTLQQGNPPAQLNFTKYGTVYYLWVNCSDIIQANQRLGEYRIRTVPPFFTDSDVTVIHVDPNIEFCFMWRHPKEQANYRRLIFETQFSHNSTTIQFVEQVVDIRHQEGGGLRCFDWEAGMSDIKLLSTMVSEWDFDRLVNGTTLTKNIAYQAVDLLLPIDIIECRALDCDVRINASHLLYIDVVNFFIRVFKVDNQTSSSFVRSESIDGSECSIGNNMCMILLSGLEQTTNYTLSISVANLRGISSIRKNFIQNFSTPAVRLIFNEVTAHSINYTVENCPDTLNVTYSGGGIANQQAPPNIISGLTPGTEYNITCGNLASRLACTHPLGPDWTNYTAITSEQTTVSIRGDLTPVQSVSGGFVGYILFFIDPPSAQNPFIIFEDLDNVSVISGLSPGTQYNFTFGGVSLCGGNRFGSSYAATTLSNVCTMPPVPNITATATSGFEIIVTLENDPSQYDGVFVKVNGSDASHYSLNTISPFASANWSSLTPNTIYTITVTLTIGIPWIRSCNYGNLSSWNAVNLTTPIDTTPSDLTSSFVTSSVCTIQWTANDGFISSSDDYSYHVLLNGVLITKVAADRETLSVNLGDLDLCASYKITVEPAIGDVTYSGLSLEIRNWQDQAMVTEIYQDFPQAVDECDVCPSADLVDTCSFPFTSGGETHYRCAERPDGSKSLFCHNANGREIVCNINAEFCLSPVPSFSGDMSFNTISPGVINITWSTTDDYYTSFMLYLNEKNFLNTTDNFHLLENLTLGETYDFEVVIESYGRIGDSQLAVFQTSDQNSNAFAYSPTTSSVKLSWDAFDSNTNDSNFVATDAINIEATFEVSDLLTSLFTAEELAAMIYNETIPLRTSEELQNLTAGFRYKIVIAGIDEQGEKIGNRSLRTDAFSVPHNITEKENNVTLAANATNGLKIGFHLTRSTTSEVIHVIITQITTHVTTSEDALEGVVIITSQKDSVSIIDMSCLTNNISCIDPSTLQFLGSAFEDEGLMPGASYIVTIYGSTGPVEGGPAVIKHIERPNPVRDLLCDAVLDDVLKITWRPPLSGSLRGFHVTLQHPDGTNTSQSVQSLLEYAPTDLIPGVNYTFYVHSTADEEGLVRSEPSVLVQGTTPKRPLGVIGTESRSSDGRTFTISVIPPSVGSWRFFEVQDITDISALTSLQSDALTSGGQARVLQNGTSNSFPISFAIGSSNLMINLAKFGTVYSVKVKTVSDFGLRSVSSTTSFLMTKMKPIQQQPSIVLNNAINICILWNVDSSMAHFDRILISIIQNNVPISQIDQPVHSQQDYGLICIDLDTLFGRSGVTFELTTLTEDRFSGLSSRSETTSYTYPLSTIIDYDVEVSVLYSQETSCGLQINLQLFNDSLEHLFRYQVLKDGQMINLKGSIKEDCNTVDSQLKCTLDIINLEPSQEYTISIELLLFEQKLPIEKLFKFTTSEVDESSSVWIYVGIAIFGTMVVMLLIILLFWQFKRLINRANQRRVTADDTYFTAGATNDIYNTINTAQNELTEYTNATLATRESQQPSILVISGVDNDINQEDEAGGVEFEPPDSETERYPTNHQNPGLNFNHYVRTPRVSAVVEEISSIEENSYPLTADALNSSHIGSVENDL